MNLKLFSTKTITFGRNFLLNYAGLFCITLLAVSFFSFNHFQDKNLDLGYYILLIPPVVFSFAFIIQLVLFVKNKITLEGYIFNKLLKSLHARRHKSFYDNLIPLVAMFSLAFSYYFLLSSIPSLVHAINYGYFDTDGNSFTLMPFLISTFFSMFTSFIGFLILQEGARLLRTSISAKNDYCIKHGISLHDQNRIMFTIYDGIVINLLFDDVIVNVKKDIAIYKKKKYKYSALNSYLNETGFKIKELSSSDWLVVDFMSI
jgi:hypothetical protein